eukprot:m.86745 g.86745  ORF g.86745 m.86745 type:complete len:50 (-) comp8770_c1_seq2:94-243(-)
MQYFLAVAVAVVVIIHFVADFGAIIAGSGDPPAISTFGNKVGGKEHQKY